jgi:hypothetical protein
MNTFFIGVDLGQAQDPSTIAVVERAELVGAWDAALYASRKVIELRLRGLERIPLGTPYLEVAARVAEVTRSPALAGGERHLAVDATGVGRPVVELIREEGPAATLMPAMVTPGDRQSRQDGLYHLPKRDVILGLQLALEREQLRIADGLRWGRELMEEMRTMERRVTAAGRETYGAMRAGAHDDLVFSVALACWAAREVFPMRRVEDGYWTDRREAARAEVFRGVVKGRK